jgi:hypothetical protein
MSSRFRCGRQKEFWWHFFEEECNQCTPQCNVVDLEDTKALEFCYSISQRRVPQSARSETLFDATEERVFHNRLQGLVLNQSRLNFANAATWILDIADVTGDYMYVEMRNCLPCCLPFIHSNVKSVGRMRVPNMLLDLSQNQKEAGGLGLSEAAESQNVALRDDERVVLVNWELVFDRKEVSVFRQDLTAASGEHLAEEAFGILRIGCACRRGFHSPPL